MKVVQCWDDGVTTDIRLTELLRRYGAKATFNLNAGLHEKKRYIGWQYQGTDVQRLGWDELRNVYEGFMVANHSLTHPHLEQLTMDDARKDIAEGRERLEQYFQMPVTGFAYPFGTYDESVMALVRDTGHVYARTTKRADQVFPPANAMAFHPSCHVLEPEFWKHYVSAKLYGVFYFWGHSFELVNEEMWQEFENMLERISEDTDSEWADINSLFDTRWN